MTEAAIHERVCGIRGELLELIGMIGSPGTRLELAADMMLDDLLVVANRLGRVAEDLQTRAVEVVGPIGAVWSEVRPGLDCPRAVSSAGRALPLQGRGRRFESGTAHRPARFARAPVPGSLQAMAKILFIPVSIVSGLIAGFIGKKTFEVPGGSSTTRSRRTPRTTRPACRSWSHRSPCRAWRSRSRAGVVDHLARRSFYKATGAWPGEERPDPT